MFLSIIIPVHNTENYLCDCLDSCLAQDIPKDDYEIICIDDCSTDSSLAILREYEEKFSNIHVIAFFENRGVSAARNTGLDYIHGEYCLFLDSDDFLLDNCLRRFRSLLSNADPKTMLCFGRFNFVEKGYSDRHEYYADGKYIGCPTERYITNRLIPSSIISNLRFQENVAYGEDEVFSLELKMQNPCIITIDEPVYFYRMHENSAMHMSTKKESLWVNSVIDSALYIRDKYGLDNQIVIDFYRERIKLVLSKTLYLSFPESNCIIRNMKKNNILSFDRSNPIGREYLMWYIKQRFKMIISRIVRKFPLLRRIKRSIFPKID